VKPVSAAQPALAPKTLALPGQRFVARQPILDRMQKVYGYELLFRNGVEDYFNADPELACRSMLDSTLLFGLTRFAMGREVPASRLHYLRLLEMVSRSELDLRELERVIKQETSICYRLLRYLNSPLFRFSLEIKSIRHAMAILGERELRRWVRLVVTVSAAEQKCSELVLMGLARARFCELLSQRLHSSSDLFLMGLLSVMDAILEVRMEALLEQLPVEREIKAALLGQSGTLRPLYQLMLAQESGEWEQSSDLARQLKLPDEEVATLWWQAMQWAQQATSGV